MRHLHYRESRQCSPTRAYTVTKTHTVCSVLYLHVYAPGHHETSTWPDHDTYAKTSFAGQSPRVIAENLKVNWVVYWWLGAIGTAIAANSTIEFTRNLSTIGYSRRSDVLQLHICFRSRLVRNPILVTYSKTSAPDFGAILGAQLIYFRFGSKRCWSTRHRGCPVGTPHALANCLTDYEPLPVEMSPTGAKPGLTTVDLLSLSLLLRYEVA